MITKEEFELHCEENGLRYEFNKIFDIEDKLNNDWNNYIFIVLCAYGYLETAQWLYSLGDIDIHYNRDGAFTGSCINNHFETAKWLYSIGANINENSYVFILCCTFGCFEIAQWLYSLGGIDIHYDCEGAFMGSCVAGKFEVVKWLYSLGLGLELDNISNLEKKRRMFSKMIICNKLEILKWLYFIDKNINKYINNNLNYFFNVSCYTNHLEIAQWLYSLGDIDIHVENDKAFRLSCEKECLEIVKWLCTLCNDYYLVIENNKIIRYRIKSSIYDIH